jgi:glycosyltransferase involved in cell wall biosynthesis
MSDEIRDRGIPLLYYHVWDNYPVPKFNKNFYKCCDYVGCISKLTHDILCQLGFQDNSDYIPHAVDMNIFKPLPQEEILKVKEKVLGKDKLDRFVVFYNSRNARRKMTSDVVKTFKMFADQVGEDKVFLLMHTDPFDHEGANLISVCEMLGIKPDNIAFSNGKLESPSIAEFYNIADVTINISNNEGFGLSCLESLCCGTPVIVNKTGGLQDQAVDDDGVELGACIEPATRSLTGSQDIPYILDDRLADEDVVAAFVRLFNMSYNDRKALGLKGRKHAEKNFSMGQLVGKWHNAIQKYVGLYKSGKNINRIKFTKV